MYTLYWEILSGVIAPQAMLEESGLDYEKVAIDMAAGEHHSPRYRACNPAGQVPALKLPDGRIIGESAAIVLLLGERHPNPGLVPQPDDADRPEFLFWLLYMATSGYMTFGRSCHPERFTTDPNAIDAVQRAAENQLEQVFDTLEKAISGAPYFLARGFTALDIYLAMLTLWLAEREAFLRTRPKIAALCDAVESRPAYRAVMRDHGLEDLDTPGDRAWERPRETVSIT